MGIFNRLAHGRIRILRWFRRSLSGTFHHHSGRAVRACSPSLDIAPNRPDSTTPVLPLSNLIGPNLRLQPAPPQGDRPSMSSTEARPTPPRPTSTSPSTSWFAGSTSSNRASRDGRVRRGDTPWEGPREQRGQLHHHPPPPRARRGALQPAGRTAAAARAGDLHPGRRRRHGRPRLRRPRQLPRPPHRVGPRRGRGQVGGEDERERGPRPRPEGRTSSSG